MKILLETPCTVAYPKRQTSVLNGKSTFLHCFPTNVDEIRSEDGPWEDLGTHQILSSLVGKQPRKVDLPFRTDVCRLGQATVAILHFCNPIFGL